MSVNENTTNWLMDNSTNNVFRLDLKFEMPNYIFTLYTLYLAGSMTIGVPVNVIILAIYYKHKPSTNVDYCILSIALLDLVCLVVVVPIYIMIQTEIWNVININTLCKALAFTGQIVTLAESFVICAMAAERFLKVCRPMSAFSLDRRGKYIFLPIILSTIIISVPNLLFSWIDYRRSCIPITTPPSIASAFFILSISLFIIMFGIVSFFYASVAKTLFQSAVKTAQYSTTYRNIMRRNQVTPLSFQTDMMPTTSFTFEQITHETSLSITGLQNDARNESSNQEMGKAACYGNEYSHRDNTNSEIKKDNENSGNNLILRKAAVSTDLLSGVHAEHMTQVEHVAANVRPREQLIPNSFENMSLPQKRRLFRTTKVSFIITITFIVSWLPVWIYTVLGFAKTFKDPYAPFFLKQSYVINTFMNPILCLACNRNFRKKAKGLFFKNNSAITS